MARGLSKLSYESLDPAQVPEPYYSLLVHEGDMTSRLEGFHESSITIHSLRSSNDGRSYFREVLLKSQSPEKVVEYGAIEIALRRLPEDVRNLILEAKRPLGGLLNEHRIPYSSTPRAFLQIRPDESIVEAFGSVESDLLYGRSNEITDARGESIARIVEILPHLEVK